jgi:hypothetical protein
VAPEVRKKISDKMKVIGFQKGNSINIGRPCSEETKRRISIANKGHIPPMKGKHQSEESNQKRSEALKGHIVSEEQREKQSQALKGKYAGEKHPMYGKRHTEDAKERISNMHKGQHHSPATQFKKGEMAGEKHPMWRGGVSFLPYCHKFNKALKERIRERDNRTCQLCGGKGHPVHHIHYDKENCYPDLITLCNSCNTKANTNRSYYEALFMNILNGRGLLFWMYHNKETV